MGSGLSQEADTQQSEVSPTKTTSQAHENHHNTKTAVSTTSTRSNNLPHEFEAILKDADTAIDKSSIDKLYDGVFLNKKRKVGQVPIIYPIFPSQTFIVFMCFPFSFLTFFLHMMIAIFYILYKLLPPINPFT